MESILPFFEQELAFLRTGAAEFSRKYPRIAGRLALAGDVSEDPHVERLIQSFALLTSRVQKRLDDDFPLFTESFFEVIYPHYLRPFPSCSIARLDAGATAAQMAAAQVVARGTELTTRPLRGVTCRFATAWETAILPVRVAQASYRSVVSAPTGSPLPRGGTSLLSVQLSLLSPQAKWDALGVKQLRIFLDGEGSQVAALREAMLGRTLGVLAQTTPVGPWHAAPASAPRAVGFEANEALVAFDERSHPAYRLLTEYFSFPEKFNFVDVSLPEAVLKSNAREVTLHFVMQGIRGDSDTAHLLETISEKSLLLGCVPVVNLFAQRADPIRITHAAASYPVLPDARRAAGYEVYAIDKVYCVRQSAQGEHIAEFKPFYSLQHEDLLAEGDGAGRYWHSHRDDELAELSPGFETEISIVDIDFDPALPQTETLSLQVRATNRDLPSLMSIGNAGGDLFIEGGSVAREIRLLRKPTASVRFERGRGALWRLISHLSLNHLTLSAGGIDAIKELLRLYNLPRSAGNRRLVDGLVSIDYKPANACLPGNPFPTFVRGTEVHLHVDEASFVGTGLRLFAQVLDHFFGLYAHANSFTQLKVFSAHSKEELIACPRRSGSTPLL